MNERSAIEQHAYDRGYADGKSGREFLLVYSSSPIEQQAYADGWKVGHARAAKALKAGK